MKLLFCLIFSIVSLNVFALINQPISNSFDATGTVQHYDKVWIKVKNGTSSTIADGTPVILDTSADDGITVKIRLTTENVPGTRVHCVADEAIAAGAMGSCLVYGYKSNALVGIYDVNGSGNADGLIDATAGEDLYLCNATAELCGSIINVGNFTWNKVGVALDNVAASAASEVFIDLL